MEWRQNLNLQAEWYRYSPFQFVNFTAIDIAQPASDIHGLVPYTAKILYRKFETHIPRNETARPPSQFPHSCFCERFIYSHDRSAYFAAAK